jgi:putative Holliday junction resolvase
MRILALDIGEKRVGLAVSDATATVATPLKVLPAAEVEGVASSFRRVLEDYEPDLILSGLPRSLSGAEGPQAQRVRAVATRVGERCGLPVAFSDERLSSAAAKRAMREQGMHEREMRGKLDAVAATLFLQAYLDAHKARGGVARPEPEPTTGTEE